ncbi:uncharacterized protein TNCV_1966421 [Trichonephila clavipes]|nr:uncharacterized protein TNCV_1966421 [Trichonephila clavipes]
MLRQISGPIFTARKIEPKNTWNKLWSDLEGEKEFNDEHMEEITDFVQSIPGFQECDEEDVETWMACDAADCGFQMRNDDEIVTSCVKVARVHKMLTRFLR